MTKTQNYHLNKPEPNDPLRVEDFNENADIIDGLLAGGVKIQTGTYTGTGGYGSGNKNTLTLDFPPKFLMVWGGGAYNAQGNSGTNFFVRYDYYYWDCVTTWSGNTVTWYSSDNDSVQMNDSGKTYYYLALG